MTKIGYDQVKPNIATEGSAISQSSNEEEKQKIDTAIGAANIASQRAENVHMRQNGAVPTFQNSTAVVSPVSSILPNIEQTPTPTVSSTTPDNHKADLIGYDNQIDILKKAQADYASANETEEERKKREKREKSKRVIAAVGDGIRALSNLYFTSQYAPNMYNPDDTQLAKVNARQEKLKAEREANRDKYLNYSLRIGDLENDRAKTVREMEAQAEKLRLAREKANREQKEHQWLSDLQPDKKREQTAKADAADSVAKTKKVEADNADAMQKAKLKTEQERGNTERTKQTVNKTTAKLRGAQTVESGARTANQHAGAVAHYAAAGASNRSNQKEFIAYDEKGQPHYYGRKDAADAYAKQHGTFKEENKTEKTTTTSKVRGRTSSRVSTKTSSGGGYSQKPPQKKSTGVKWK